MKSLIPKQKKIIKNRQKLNKMMHVKKEITLSILIKFGWFSSNIEKSCYFLFLLPFSEGNCPFMLPVSKDLCFLCWKLLEEMTVTSENPTMRGLIRYWRCMTVMMKTWNMKTMITEEDQRQYCDNILTNIAPSSTHQNTLLWNIPSAHSSPGLTI